MTQPVPNPITDVAGFPDGRAAQREAGMFGAWICALCKATCSTATLM